MKVFVFDVNDRVHVGTVTGELSITDTISISIPEGQSYIILDNEDLPNEPQESWYIEDGEIKIDQQKLIEHNRQNMPRLTPIEFDIKLNNNGLYDAVQELIKDDFEMRIAYNRVIFFSRTDPFIDQARIALGLTDDQVDLMWMS